MLGVMVPFLSLAANSFSNRYGRANEEPKKKCVATSRYKISAKTLKLNWPNMTNKEKMQWKFQRYMQDYLAAISSVDDNVGKSLETILKRQGLDKNAIVVYTLLIKAFTLGEHGWFDKRFIYDGSFETPTSN